MQLKEITLTVRGMVCGGCEDAVQRALQQLEGVEQVEANHDVERVWVLFNPSQTSSMELENAITTAGYEVVKPKTDNQPIEAVQVRSGHNAPPSRLRSILVFIALFVLVGGVVQWGRSLMPNVMMQINSGVSLATLFMIGFFTGFHCIGMCGSFVVSYVDKSHSVAKSALSHAAYGGGKTLSYAVIGAFFGFLGALVTVTSTMRGYAAIFAGLFLFLFGLKMLKVIPQLGILNLRFPKAMTNKVNEALGRSRRPFTTGLLNGLLLGCGPLQAMYIMAAGTGSPIEGALMLCFFGLGTLPALLGFGFFASYLSMKSIHQIMRVSGVLVILMGGMMLMRGVNLLNSTPGVMGN